MGFFDKIQETITSATEQTKAKADEVQLKRERGKKLEALGEQVLALYTSGRLAHQELAPACQEIAELDLRISEAMAAGQAARPAPPAQQQAPPQDAAPPAPPAPPPPPVEG